MKVWNFLNKTNFFQISNTQFKIKEIIVPDDDFIILCDRKKGIHLWHILNKDFKPNLLFKSNFNDFIKKDMSSLIQVKKYLKHN